MRVEISVDDGTRLDIKVMNMLDKYRLHGIFYIPVLTTELTPREIFLLSLQHEIGAHTMTHPQDIKRLSDEDVRYEVIKSKIALEAITGKPVHSFCYPRGRFNAKTKEIVEDAGFLWARTARVNCFTESKDPFETDTSVHFYHGRKEYNGDSLIKRVSDGLKKASETEDGYFHLWLHSNEVDKHNLWSQLEEAFKYVKYYKSLPAKVK